MDFPADPSDLIAPVEAAWGRYVRAGAATLAEIESRVVETRHAAEEDWWFLPVHPLWDRFRIADRGDPWRPRPLRWAPEGEGTTPHGLDAAGRILTAGRYAIVYGDGFHDILFFGPDRLPYRPEDETGFAKGRLTRLWTDDAGRIVAAAQVNQEREEPHCHFRTVQRFEYDAAGRFVQSHERWYRRGRKADETPETHPEVAPGYYELPYMRERVSVSYDDAGRLVGAESTDEFRGGEEILYSSRDADDTIEGLVAEFSELLGKQLVKAIDGFLKATPGAKPAARCALLYSAEHAHCGLPAGVLSASEADATADGFEPLDWEAYSREIDWPPEGRAGKKLADLHRRLLIAVEGDPAYAETFQPRPYREVLWKAGRAAWQTLKKKRSTAANFALFPLDDHGDVDPAEDVRETLPAEVAGAIIDRKRG